MQTWEVLLKRAIRQIEAAKLPDSAWCFGGGTVFYHDRNVMASYAKSFAPFLHILENRIEALQQSGELQQALADIAVLPGSKQIYGQEYHLCKLFFWKLKQLSQVHKHEQAASPKRGFKL